MVEWSFKLNYNPVPALLESGNEAITVLTERDFLDNTVSTEDLWQLPESRRILRKQKPDGSWLYPGGNKDIRTQENYNQLETYRNLGILVEQYGLNKKHTAIQETANYLFTFQTIEGDFRGIYGNQYSPNYTAGITELLIKAGYQHDSRINKVFEWLLSIRQEDGGWTIPFRTRDHKIDIISSHERPLDPDKSKPFSHMVTGVVLRAFAAHPTYRQSKEAKQAGGLLLSNLFKRDHYPDRAAPEYWLRFSFPFWFTDLISALDSLSLLGFSESEPQIQKALRWFVINQQKSGLWELKILKGQKRDVLKIWLALSICRIFKRLFR
jgi:hypothetical protein